MQAWRVHRNGEPSEVMELEETDRPTPGDGQVLLEVRAANINFPDALLCRGQYQVRPPLPFTPGVEICGVTEVGRRVLATPALPEGGFAEYVVADEAALLGARRTGRRGGRGPAHRLPDRLVRAAPAGTPAGR